MLGSAQIPVRLNSSSNPATNSPSDETAASAFSSHVSEKDQGTPLCDVQMKYTGTLEGTLYTSALPLDCAFCWFPILS